MSQPRLQKFGKFSIEPGPDLIILREDLSRSKRWGAFGLLASIFFLLMTPRNGSPPAGPHVISLAIQALIGANSIIMLFSKPSIFQLNPRSRTIIFPGTSIGIPAKSITYSIKNDLISTRVFLHYCGSGIKYELESNRKSELPQLISLLTDFKMEEVPPFRYHK